MFPGGLGGRNNPKQLAAMMRQMGIEMEELKDVEEVIIRLPDREIVLRDADVSKMKARGEITWQIMGKETSRPRTDKEQAPAIAPSPPVKATITQEDIDLVASQANVSKDAARKALEATNGEPAEAILKLLGDE